MSVRRCLPVFALGLAAALSLGCSNRVPPRPVPPPEGVPELPPWYPETPWTSKTKGDRTFFGGKIVFDTARHTIRPESERVLKKLLTWLQENPDVSRVRLEGHTDSRAGEEYNQGLSERRAIAVADWLVDNGLDHTRILAVAFGETRPLVTNDNAVGRQENRRASFMPAEVNGRRWDDKDPTNGGLVLTVLSKEEREALKKKGEIPQYVPPPLKAERDIFKPVYQPRKTKSVGDRIFGTDRPVIDAASGKETNEGKPEE